MNQIGVGYRIIPSTAESNLVSRVQYDGLIEDVGHLIIEVPVLGCGYADVFFVRTFNPEPIALS